MEFFAILFFSLLILALLCMFATAKKLSTNKKQERGNKVIACFEPDNIAPETSQMINFHKKNGTVDYLI